MKKHLLALSAVAMLAPALHAQNELLDRMPEVEPILVGTAQELSELRTKIVDGADNYIIITNDIDMTGVPYSSLVSEMGDARLFIDGCGHVISNLTVAVVNDDNSTHNPAFAGKLVNGWIKNLGLENIHSEQTWFQVGGFTSIMANSAIDNCFITGTVIGAASGAIAGSPVGSNNIISNCYSTAQVKDTAGGHCGGLAGRVDSPLTIENCYCAGDVEAVGNASGIVTVRNSKSVTLKNVVEWASTVTGSVAAEAVIIPGAETTVTQEGVLVSQYLSVNGTEYAAGVDEPDLFAAIEGWEAFSKTAKVDDFYPALKWQENSGAGIGDIITDSANDAPAVYYNLQGVQVANPENGIYIVRRGEKVTKEVIR